MPRTIPTEPILTWQDTRGYTLSDRIWAVGDITADQIDKLLQESIASGTPSLTLAKQLEQYLIPGRNLRTDRPYGTDVSYYAMRLARSEITRGFSLATSAAANANPLVNRMYYHLSAAHVHTPNDPCEQWAAQSNAQDGFPKDECPLPMVDTHPQCICYLTMGVISKDEFLTQYGSEPPQEWVDRVQPFLDPAEIGRFVLAIIGLLPEFWKRIFN